MKILGFAGSVRKESINKKLLQCAENHLRGSVDVESIPFETMNIPLYDGDVEAESGIPESVLQYAAKIEDADGWILALPEYNSSISGPVKNLIDWLSRMRPTPIKNIPILLISASPSAVGGIRGLWHARVPLDVLGAHVYPSMFALAGAGDTSFNGNELTDEKLHSRLINTLDEFVSYCDKLK
jgi:NAD(P)H-dependent FMN reductase